MKKFKTMVEEITEILESGLAKTGNGFKIPFNELKEKLKCTSSTPVIIALNTITQFNAWDMISHED